MQNSQFRRQQGLVDQELLQQKNILISGSSIGVSNLLVLLDQVGFGSGPGSITILRPNEQPNSPIFHLHYPGVKSWSCLGKSNHGNIILIDRVINTDVFDYHLSVNSVDSTSADFISYFAGPRAKLSRDIIVDHVEGNHTIPGNFNNLRFCNDSSNVRRPKSDFKN